MVEKRSVVLSRHRLTCLWLPQDEPAATGFLSTFRRAKPEEAEGHIEKNYDPQELPPERPGYGWLKKQLSEIVASGEPFDSAPEFDPKAQRTKKPWDICEPFPALVWQPAESCDLATRGFLEILVGGDYVVFHQYVAARVKGGAAAADILATLAGNSWFIKYNTPDAFCVRTFVCRSDDNFENRDATSEYRTSCERLRVFLGDENGLELQLTSRQGSQESGTQSTPPPNSMLSPSLVKNGDPLQDHTERARDFINQAATLIVPAQKVDVEYTQASTYFESIEQNVTRQRDWVDMKRTERAGELPPVLAWDDIARLQDTHRLAREDVGKSSQLVDTCLRNANKFRVAAEWLLSPEDPWARATGTRVLSMLDWLQAWHRALDQKLRSLMADVEQLITAGTRPLSIGYAQGLLRFGEKASQLWPDESRYQVLIYGDKPPDEPESRLEKMSVWKTGALSEDPEADEFLVLRPVHLRREQADDLANYYLHALRECSEVRLTWIIESLFCSNGVIRLSNGKQLPVGKLLSDPGTSESNCGNDKLVCAICPLHQVPSEDAASRAGASSVEKVKPQDQVSLMSLLAFLEAFTELIERPPRHLASIAQKFRDKRQRLLFLAAILHVWAGRGKLAAEHVSQSARVALRSSDFPWAYFVTQFCDEHEGAIRTSLDDSRQRIGVEFLHVFDLCRAIAIAASTGRDHALGRARLIRGMLWGTALSLATFLPVADWSVSAGILGTKWRGVTLVLVTAVGLLGAPVALRVGAGGALRLLLPDILYPRILGAITVAAISFCATVEMAKALTEVSQRPLLIAVMAGTALVGGLLYMHSEVSRVVHDASDRWYRSLDLFSLAFLEATTLATVVVVIYHTLFAGAPESFAYSLHGFIVRPLAILMVAVQSLFVGIVIQLLFQPREAGARAMEIN